MFSVAKIVGTGDRFSINGVCRSVFGFEHAVVRIKSLENEWFGEISFAVSLKAQYFMQLHQIFHSADIWLDCLAEGEREILSSKLVDEFCSYFFFDIPDSNNFYRNLGKSAFIGPQIRLVAGLMKLASTYPSFDAGRKAHN